MNEIRTSYTVHRQYGLRVYRAAIRRRHDDGVIWECNHWHGTISHPYGVSAMRCAQDELHRRLDAHQAGVAPSADGSGGGGCDE